MKTTFRNKDVFMGMQQVVRFASRDVPFKISYACGKSLARLREQFDLIETERQKIIKKYQLKGEDGTLLAKKAVDALGREIDVPKFKDDVAVEEDLKALQAEDVEIDVHSIELSVWNEHMQKAKCKTCDRAVIDVSSDEMAALIKLGILIEDSD